MNGAPAPDGMPIEAIRGLVEDIVCGETTTKNGEYTLLVLSGFGGGAEFGKGCHGSEIIFRSGELIAAERGRPTGAEGEVLDLTFGSTAPPTVPPQLPDTGFGVRGGSGTPAPPWLLWALIPTGIVAVGAAAIARTRNGAAMSP